jgi:acetyl-CoA C-acetyltransferase
MPVEAYIYDGVRTPFGRHGGKLASVRPDDMAATVIRNVVERNLFPPDAYEDVLLGCTNQAGEDCRNVARHAGLLAGLPVHVAGQTVNRLCASGLAAVLDAARAVTCGEGELFVAGGVESMTRAPFAIPKAESSFSREAKIYDTTIGSRFPNSAFVAAFGNDSMTETAENVARELGIGRAESDAFACESQRRYARAKKDGFYEGEITGVAISTGKKTPPLMVCEDEHPRPETTLEALTKLRPLFEGGIVTAGSASGINDGAAALVVGSLKSGERFGVKPRARIVAGAAAGVPPRLMGLGPVPASKKCLERAGLSLADMDVIELNEAFAAQVLGCLKQMNLAADDSRLNQNGGAIAIGHPLGASGARLALTAMRQLECQGGRYALVTLCIGVGQGLAVVLERAS